MFRPDRFVALLVALLLLLPMLALPAFAVNPDEILENPVLEKRARDLSSEIRCMKCQNQSIDDLDAELARDLRILVRDRLVAGDSDQEVLDFLVDRFGEFVLLKPKFSLPNLFLWAAPVIALAAGLLLSLRMMRRRKVQSVTETTQSKLSRDEHEQLTKILDDRD